MTDYSRGDYADLPAGKTDLENNYSAPDLTAIASNDNSTYAEQTANNEIAIHQYKKTVTGQYINITWSGKSSLAPSESPVIMEVYNVTGTPAWEELDRDDSTAADTDFDIIYNNLATADYLDSGVITWRVYQAASVDSGIIAGWNFENNWTAAYGSYDLTPYNTPTFDNTIYIEGSYSANFALASLQYAENTDLHLPAQSTICFWIYLITGPGWAGLVGHPVWSGAGLGLELSGQALYIRTDVDITTGFSFNLNEWHHVGITLDTSNNLWTGRMWHTADPATDNNNTLTGSYNTAGNFRLAAMIDHTDAYMLNGKLDQLRIFNRILTLDEITQVRLNTFSY